MSSTPPAPYSRFREFGDLVAFSGQVGTQDGKLVAGGFLPELHQCLANLSRLLEQAGLTPSDIVQDHRLPGRHRGLADAQWTLGWNSSPSRVQPWTAIAVSGLPFGARVEVEAWAVRPAR